MKVSLKELRGEALEPISYYMKAFDTSFSMSRHYHSYIEFMYCQSGQFMFEALETGKNGRHEFVSHKISAGEFIIIDAMVPHRIYDTDATIMNAEFEPRNKSEYNPFDIFSVFSFNYANFTKMGAWMQIAREKNGFCILPDTEGVGTCFRLFLKELFDEASGFEHALSVQCKLAMLLTEIGKCRNIGNPKAGNLWYIRRAQEYISHNFASDIHIENIAEAVGVSKAYLQRIYRAHTGMTILRSINTVRVERAKKMLTGSNLSVKQVGEQSGFKNSQHFIYEFKRFTGITPNEYRKEAYSEKYDHESPFYESDVFGKR